MSMIVSEASQHLSTLNLETLILTILKSSSIIVSVIFLVFTMILTNILQLGLSPLALYSRPMLYEIYSYVAGFLWLFFQFIAEKLSGARIETSGTDCIPENESALLISNHCSFIDSCLVQAISIHCKMVGNCRFFAKNSIKYIPFFGWGMYLAGFIFLKRNWNKDQNKINATFENLVNYRLPVHLISFLEGTRLTNEKRLESQKYAAEHNLPRLEHVLIPRTKGFIASIQGLRNSHINHVYDITIAFYHHKRGFGVTPTLSDFFLGKLNEFDFKVHVDRYSMSEIPETDKEIADWTVKLFAEKDTRLSKWKLELDSKWKRD